MDNSKEENLADLNAPRTRTNILDKTPLVKSSEGHDVEDWTFRKKLEDGFLALQFKSRKFSHEKELETRLADSLWLTWHRVSRNHPSGSAVDMIEVRVTFDSHETTVSINCYGTSSKGHRPYRVENMKLVLHSQDTTELFHHIHHFLTKPRSW